MGVTTVGSTPSVAACSDDLDVDTIGERPRRAHLKSFGTAGKVSS